MPTADLIGVVLAGGRSRRMGQDKAGLQFEGRTLLARTVELARSVVHPVLVAVREDQITDPLRRQFDLILDPPGDIGPIGAIFEALERHPGCAVLALAVDLHRLDAESLHSLIEHRDPLRVASALVGDNDAPHPLCAIWEPRAAPALAIAIAQGQLSPRRFLEQQDVQRVDAPDPGQLRGANRPEDLDDAG